jgi:hypothetical protein
MTTPSNPAQRPSPAIEGLLPCPFCGGSNIEALDNFDWICCQDCGASLEDVEPSARELWNTRSSSAAYTAKEPRFFIDHGMIHDRQTGKHVTTEADSAFNDGILRCCELLNALAEQREPKPFPLLFDSNWLEDKIKTDPDIDCEVGPSLSSTHSQGTP